MLRVRAVDEVDEAEAAALARLAVDRDVHARDLAEGAEEVLLKSFGFSFFEEMARERKKIREEGEVRVAFFCF